MACLCAVHTREELDLLHAFPRQQILGKPTLQGYTHNKAGLTKYVANGVSTGTPMTAHSSSISEFGRTILRYTVPIQAYLQTEECDGDFNREWSLNNQVENIYGIRCVICHAGHSPHMTRNAISLNSVNFANEAFKRDSIASKQTKMLGTSPTDNNRSCGLSRFTPNNISDCFANQAKKYPIASTILPDTSNSFEIIFSCSSRLCD